MGEKYLFQIFIENEINDLQMVILRGGINGLMIEFESWLQREKIIDENKAKELRGRSI